MAVKLSLGLMSWPVTRNRDGVPVSVVELFTLPTAAWIVVGPSSRIVAMPAVEIVDTVVSDEVQVTPAVTLPTLPSENVPVAVNCFVAATGTDTWT